MLKKKLFYILCACIITPLVSAQQIIKSPYSIFEQLCPNADQLSEMQFSDESLTYSDLLNACGIPISQVDDNASIKLANSSTDVTMETLKLDAKTAKENFDNVVERAKFYLTNLDYFKDNYGLYTYRQNGQLIGQGDALIWNNVLLTSMCQTQSWYEANKAKIDAEYAPHPFDLKKRISDHWNAIKTGLYLPNGRPVRHPTRINSTDQNNRGESTISHDGITSTYYLGAIAKYTKCSPVADEFGDVINRMANYARKHRLNMAGDGNYVGIDLSILGSTVFFDSVLKLYNYPTGHWPMPLKHLIRIPDFLVPLVSIFSGTNGTNGSYAKVAYCKIHDNGPVFKSKFCKLWSYDSSTSYHLNHLLTVVAYIVAKEKGTIHFAFPNISIKRADKMLKRMARLKAEGIPNWLHVVTYRHFSKQSANDVIEALLTFPKDRFPSNDPKDKVLNLGCSDFIWQRIPQAAKCSNNGELYNAGDFLKAFAWLVQPHPEDHLNTTER